MKDNNKIIDLIKETSTEKLYVEERITLAISCLGYEDIALDIIEDFSIKKLESYMETVSEDPALWHILNDTVSTLKTMEDIYQPLNKEEISGLVSILLKDKVEFKLHVERNEINIYITDGNKVSSFCLTEKYFNRRKLNDYMESIYVNCKAYSWENI